MKKTTRATSPTATWSTADARQHTREFMAQLFRVAELRDDDDIFAAGYVNSLFAMRLVQFVERTFGVPIAGSDLTLDNFRSIDRIVGFVERKQRDERASASGA